jgi:hypothetical protein
MKRIEVIFSQAIEEDVFMALRKIPEAQAFTLIPGVKGKGCSTPKMGDSVWPEFNELMIIYCPTESGAREIADAVDRIRKRFPTEGIAAFTIDC